MSTSELPLRCTEGHMARTDGSGTCRGKHRAPVMMEVAGVDHLPAAEPLPPFPIREPVFKLAVEPAPILLVVGLLMVLGAVLLALLAAD